MSEYKFVSSILLYRNWNESPIYEIFKFDLEFELDYKEFIRSKLFFKCIYYLKLFGFTSD